MADPISPLSSHPSPVNPQPLNSGRPDRGPDTPPPGPKSDFEKRWNNVNDAFSSISNTGNDNPKITKEQLAETTKFLNCLRPQPPVNGETQRLTARFEDNASLTISYVRDQLETKLVMSSESTAGEKVEHTFTGDNARRIIDFLPVTIGTNEDNSASELDKRVSWVDPTGGDAHTTLVHHLPDDMETQSMTETAMHMATLQFDELPALPVAKEDRLFDETLLDAHSEMSTGKTNLKIDGVDIPPEYLKLVAGEMDKMKSMKQENMHLKNVDFWQKTGEPAYKEMAKAFAKAAEIFNGQHSELKGTRQAKAITSLSENTSQQTACMAAMSRSMALGINEAQKAYRRVQNTGKAAPRTTVSGNQPPAVKPNNSGSPSVIPGVRKFEITTNPNGTGFHISTTYAIPRQGENGSYVELARGQLDIGNAMLDQLTDPDVKNMLIISSAIVAAGNDVKASVSQGITSPVQTSGVDQQLRDITGFFSGLSGAGRNTPEKAAQLAETSKLLNRLRPQPPENGAIQQLTAGLEGGASFTISYTINNQQPTVIIKGKKATGGETSQEFVGNEANQIIDFLPIIRGKNEDHAATRRQNISWEDQGIRHTSQLHRIPPGMDTASMTATAMHMASLELEQELEQLPANGGVLFDDTLRDARLEMLTGQSRLTIDGVEIPNAYLKCVVEEMDKMEFMTEENMHLGDLHFLKKANKSACETMAKAFSDGLKQYKKAGHPNNQKEIAVIKSLSENIYQQTACMAAISRSIALGIGEGQKAWRGSEQSADNTGTASMMAAQQPLGSVTNTDGTTSAIRDIRKFEITSRPDGAEGFHITSTYAIPHQGNGEVYVELARGQLDIGNIEIDYLTESKDVRNMLVASSAVIVAADNA